MGIRLSPPWNADRAALATVVAIAGHRLSEGVKMLHCGTQLADWPDGKVHIADDPINRIVELLQLSVADQLSQSKQVTAALAA